MILTLAALTIAVSNVAARPVVIHVDPASQWDSYAFIGEPAVWLGYGSLQRAERGDAFGLLALLHEVGHTTGITNEAQATCFALSHLRPFARRWFHTSRRDAQVLFVDARWYMRWNLPAEYQCGSVT